MSLPAAQRAPARADAAPVDAAPVDAAGRAASGLDAGRDRQAGGTRHDDTVERAFAAAVADPGMLDDLLDALRAGWLWLPLPDDGAPVTDGCAVRLPALRYLGGVYVPAYTCAARLLQAAGEPGDGARPPGQGAVPPAVPHVVVRAADLARLLPPGTGIALNPAGSHSIPVSPAGVAQIAAVHTTVGGRRVSVGPAPLVPAALLAALAAGLRAVPAVREAATAWLSVGPAAGTGEAVPCQLAASGAEAGGAEPGGAAASGAGAGGAGLVIAVWLDDPGDPAARDAALAAVQGAVAAVPGAAPWPADVTFPGEGEPDVIDGWMAGAGARFYQRDVLAARLPAPRRPVA